MSLVNTLLVAASLSVDCCAVALARGLAAKPLRARDAVLVGVTFGAFQGLMPVAGAFAGGATAELFARIDHWIAFGVLAALGVKSLLEAREVGRSGESRSNGGLASLLIAAVATSIDALAAGFGFSLVGEPIAPLACAAAAFAAVGGAACYLGGASVGTRFQRGGLIAGGVVLIAIGVNVLREHGDHL